MLARKQITTLKSSFTIFEKVFCNTIQVSVDVMHSIIMRNNDINYILTFNERDFNKIPGFTVLDPRNIKFAS